MRAFWSHSWRGPWKFVRSHIMLVKRMPRYLVPTEECTCIIMAGAKKIWLCLIKIRYPDLLDIQYQSFFQWRCGYGTVVTLTLGFFGSYTILPLCFQYLGVFQSFRLSALPAEWSHLRGSRRECIFSSALSPPSLSAPLQWSRSRTWGLASPAWSMLGILGVASGLEPPRSGWAFAVCSRTTQLGPPLTVWRSIRPFKRTSFTFIAMWKS